MAQHTYNPRTGKLETLDEMMKQGRLERAVAVQKLFQGLRARPQPAKCVEQGVTLKPHRSCA